MGRLLRLLPVLIYFLALAPVRAADDCAIVVKITGTEGAVMQPTVEVRDATGALQRVDIKTASGRVEICDLDFGVYSITARYNGYDLGNCYPTTISNVQVRAKTTNLTIALNPCLDAAEIWSNACWRYMRVRSNDGRALASATLRYQDRASKGEGSQKADSYGRIWFRLPWDFTLDANVSAPGYQAETFILSCDQGQRNREVRLRPSRP